MSKIMRQSISWSLVVAMLIATMGISVHQIYCYCAGETTVSLFDEGSKCAKTEMQGSCCKVELPACCAKNTADDGCVKEKDGGDCTQKTTKVFQLKAKYLVEHLGFKSFDFPAWVEELPEYKRLFREAVCLVSTFNKAPPPLPSSGREISIRLQIFRC